MIVEFFNLGKAGVGRLQALYHLISKYQAQRVLVLCADIAQAEELDEQLWAYDAAGFLPHGLAGAPDSQHEPVLLSTELNNSNKAQVLVLAYNPPEGWLPPKNFKRVVELLPVEEGPGLNACRNRYRLMAKQATLEHTTVLQS